jgi:hypothetical protein
MSTGSGPAPSGARLLGDDYQHLLTWLHAAQLLHRDPEIVRVELEKQAAGNVDDLVVHRRTGPVLYHQVKFTTYPGEPLTADWFVNARAGSQPPLRRFYDSFHKLNVGGQPPEMVLHTNRLPAARDPVLSCLDGTTELLVPRLKRAGSASDAGKARAAWAAAIGVSEDDLLEMLAALRIRAAQASLADLQERCRWVMQAVGLIGTRESVDRGMLAARRWIEEGTREVDAPIVSRLVDEQTLRASEPTATLLIQAIDHDLWPETASVAIDWVDAFAGERPSERREPHDPGVWSTRFVPDLHAAEAAIRLSGERRVRIDGAFRLATAVFAGAVLADVRGFRVSVPGRAGDGTWIGDISSDGPRRTCELREHVVEVGAGEELAVGLNVSGDLTDAVIRQLAASGIEADRLVVLSIEEPSREALTDADDVRGWVQAVTNRLRALVEGGAPRLHLFFYGPRTAATLLGHSWNRMPATQLWDDLGPGRGYTPAFVIPSS